MEKEEGTRGGGKDEHKEKREEQKGGDKLDTDQSIKLDLMNIKFRYLDLLNTINLPMVLDKNFNG